MHINSVIFLFLAFLFTVKAGQVKAQTSNLSNALNRFSFDIYNATKVENENLFLSPPSTYYSLLMLYEGSKNKTKQEFEEVLHLDNSETLGNDYLNNLVIKSGRNAGINVFNAIWLDKNIQAEPAFINCVTQKYSTDLKRIDFADAQSVVLAINRWIAEKTNRRITQMMTAGNIDSDTKLLVSNATYFREEWQNKFDRQNTSFGIFYATEKNQFKTDFMKITERLHYFENEDFQFISKPYKDSDLSFCVVLPKKLFALEDVENTLNEELFSNNLQNVSYAKVAFSIPKFKLQSDCELSEALQNVGLISAFSDQADFSGITQKNPLILDQVLHKTWIELDEEKAEAAAATASAAKIMGRPSYKVFKADHPFVFFITDDNTNTILFMGRYVKPENGQEIYADLESLSTNIEKRQKEEFSAGNENQKILYIVDKKIVSTFDVKAINPDDIDSVKVIKDQAEISKYSSGDYDGIVIITCKQNKKNQ